MTFKDLTPETVVNYFSPVQAMDENFKVVDQYTDKWGHFTKIEGPNGDEKHIPSQIKVAGFWSVVIDIHNTITG